MLKDGCEMLYPDDNLSLPDDVQNLILEQSHPPLDIGVTGYRALMPKTDILNGQ